MNNMVNFGIDLGTTNSAIAKFVKGEVKVFNNPSDFGRNTLPSVVGFKKNKIIVGSKAKELSTKDAKNVISVFKRKMGTSESYKIPILEASRSPIELSSIILKELKTFLPPEEKMESAVITIPASFSSIQSNATATAGQEAGIKDVSLLQEPIAASLAYANQKQEYEIKEGNWLVYDLGGGTFDAALLKIIDNEMKVIDHEGDNFMGGADFDKMIFDNLIIPKLENDYNFNDLSKDMKSNSGKYNKQYINIMFQLEEAKIDLSSKLSTEIEISGFEDDTGEDVDVEYTITRSEFNDLIRPIIDKSIELTQKIITRNNLQHNDVMFTLMIGGSTYIPLVRERTQELLNIPINCNIDPTTAVAIGSAFYASTKKVNIKNKENPIDDNYNINIKAHYETSSKENEELFAAKITGDIEGLFYRIVRGDGGYDSGLKKLSNKITDDLPLVEGVYNYFSFNIFDDQNNHIKTNFSDFGISSGYTISGQPLPDDICLEVDDDNDPGKTKLELIAKKNTILPLRKTFNKELNKSLTKGNQNDKIRINVLEGPHTSTPLANLPIGYIEITGDNISRNISKGSDIELTFEISESRIITISAYLNMSDQEFKEVFEKQELHCSVNQLQNDVSDLSKQIDEEIEQANKSEDYETSEKLNKIRKEVDSLSVKADTMIDDDNSDEKFQIEANKRQIAQNIVTATKTKLISNAIKNYMNYKEKCSKLIDEHGNDYETKQFNDIVEMESTFLNSENHIKINDKSDDLYDICMGINWRVPEFIVAMFQYCIDQRTKLNNSEQANIYIESGNKYIEEENWEKLTDVVRSLFSLFPNNNSTDVITKVGF